MKKIIFIISCIMILFSSCKKDEDQGMASQLVGAWELTMLDGSAVASELSVWIDFSSDGTVVIYQRADSETMYTMLSGTWSVSGKTLKGTYDDGSSWASDYEISINGSELKVISRTTEKEETVYKRADLPASVKENVSHKS